jgi:hypothetical protein
MSALTPLANRLWITAKKTQKSQNQARPLMFCHIPLKPYFIQPNTRFCEKNLISNSGGQVLTGPESSATIDTCEPIEIIEAQRKAL